MAKRYSVGKKIIFIVIIISVMFLLLKYWLFSSMINLPEGEYLQSSISPENDYKINAYVSIKSLSDDAIRCEVEDLTTGKTRNLYWEYKKSEVNINWIDKKTVNINGKILDVTKDKYDWRKDDDFENQSN